MGAMSGRGRFARGRGRGRGSVGGLRSDWVDSGGKGRGKARGKGLRKGDGHDDRVARHVVKSDHVLKSRRPFGRGTGRGKGKGKGDNLYRPPALRGASDKVCNDFARTGQCPRGSRCSYPHVRVQPNTTEKVEEDAMHRHCEVPNAHAGAITAIAMQEQGIYTASQDKCLKRWKPEKDATGRFHLKEDLKVELQEACFCMCCIGSFIFCGLWDGTVKAFSQDGANSDLRGHTKRVTAIIQHQSILITGGADRDVRLWQMDPGTKSFRCSHTLNDSIPGPISCLYVLGENLWIGGMSGIAMLNLGTLKVTKLLPPVKPVSKFLEFQAHVVAAYADGALRVFDGDGNQKSEMPALAAGPIASLGGLEAGPRLLCGHSHGQVSSIILPDFAFKTQYQAFQDTAVESLFCPGQDGLFLFGSKSGSLQLWQKIG